MLQKGDKLKFKDYQFFKANRKKSKKAKRGSGGVLIFYKEQDAKGICRKKSSDKKHVTLKSPQTKNTLHRYSFLAYMRTYILQAAIFHPKIWDEMR